MINGIVNLKMGDSPIKKGNLDVLDKENVNNNNNNNILITPDDEPEKDESGSTVEKKAVVVAPAIKAEEADEPLLQENPHRFVLFPIKYHEVSFFAGGTRGRVTRRVVTRHANISSPFPPSPCDG